MNHGVVALQACGCHVFVRVVSCFACNALPDLAEGNLFVSGLLLRLIRSSFVTPIASINATREAVRCAVLPLKVIKVFERIFVKLVKAIDEIDIFFKISTLEKT